MNFWKIRPLPLLLLIVALLPFLAVLDLLAWFGNGGLLCEYAPQRLLRPSLASKVDPRTPEIARIARAIRRMADTPIGQAELVDRAVFGLVDYDFTRNVWGKNIHYPTVSELERKRREMGWDFWRGDCTAHAIVCASALSALGMRWQIRTSDWMSHAWVAVWIDGKWYEIDPPEKDPSGNRIPWRLDDDPKYRQKWHDPDYQADLRTLGLVPDGPPHFVSPRDRESPVITTRYKILLVGLFALIAGGWTWPLIAWGHRRGF